MGKTIFQAFFSFVFVLLLLFPNLFASWGLIDDHQIIRNLGSDEKMGFSEIPEKLRQTEVFFTKERITRYRPAYWLANLTETAAWGGKAEYWYRFRLLLIGTSIFITWHLLSKKYRAGPERDSLPVPVHPAILGGYLDKAWAG